MTNIETGSQNDNHRIFPAGLLESNKNRVKVSERGPSQLLSFVFIIAISILYFIRIFNLDADLPPWGVGGYQPIDEGIYANLALNYINFGSINPNDFYQGSYTYLIQAQVVCDVVTNLATGFTLFLFGDNYFGLRMGSILLGYISLIMLYLTLKELGHRDGEYTRLRQYLVFLITTVLLVSFSFCEASRVVEPSLARMLFVLLLAYLFVRRNIKDGTRAFLSGFLVIFSIFFVYFSNLFLGIPLIAFVVFLLCKKQIRRVVIYLSFGIIGAVCAFILAFFYYKLIWDIAPLTGLLESVYSFQANASVSSAYSSSLLGTSKNIRSFATSNVFFYAPAFVVFIVIGLGNLINKVFKEDREDIFLLFFVVGGLLLQTAFTQDYIFRKSIVILPVVLLLAYQCLLSFNTLRTKTNSQKAFFIVLTIALLFYLAYLILYRLYLSLGPAETRLDFTHLDRILLVIQYLLTGAGLVVLVIGVFRNATPTKHFAIAFIFSSFFLVNSYFIINYHFVNQTYSEKEAMIRLGEVADAKIVCGEYENGFTLYNDILPLLNHPDTLKDYMINNPDIFYFDYSGAEAFNLDPNSLNQNIEKVKVYQREFQTFGDKRSVTLYSSR